MKNTHQVISAHFLAFSVTLVAFSGCTKEKIEDLNSSMSLKYEACPATTAANTSAANMTAGRTATTNRSASSCAGAQTINSVASGAWDSPATWAGGVIPTPCDHVIIKHAVVYNDQPGTPGYTHYGDINVNPQGSFDFLEDGDFEMEGEDSNHRSNLIVNAHFYVKGDLVLENVHMVANPQGQVRLYKDLILDEGTSIENNTLACNGFVVGDDVILLDAGINPVIHSTHSPIIVGAGPGQTPNMSEQGGSLSLLDPTTGYIFGVAGTSAAQIDVVPPHGPKGYALPTTCGALPIHFTSVGATWDGQRTVNVTWSTGMEMNSKSFVVEMTLPCTSSPIAASGPIPAAGVSTGNKQYSFPVPVSKGGTYLFRVVEVDIDGSKTYSNTVLVRVGNK